MDLPSGDEHPDQELFDRAAAGDRDALERLLVVLGPKLGGYVKRLMPKDLQRITDPDDLLQDVYRQAFERIADLRGKPADVCQRWLFTVARNRVIDELRRQGAQKRGGLYRRLATPGADWQASMAILLDDLLADSHTPSRSAANHEVFDQLHQAIEELPADYRRAIEMRYFEGMNVAEIAHRMARTERAVHNLCTRALQRLRDLMGSRSRFFSSS